MAASNTQGRAKTNDEPSRLLAQQSAPDIETIGRAFTALASKLEVTGAAASRSSLQPDSSAELQRLDDEMRIKSALVHLKEARTELLHIERALAELALHEGFTLRQVGPPLGVSLSTLSKWKLNSQYFAPGDTQPS
ncbi:MAG: hypothetical protein ABJB03_00855 [Rhodoglobus sp.]